MEIKPELLARQRHRRFGRKNPERMDIAFWVSMVQNGRSAFWAKEEYNFRWTMRSKPVWCFLRMGMTETQLPDGRTICIGGEHEDWYDPDFCIYNDVIVRTADAAVTIYGYPRSVFPPTDFHTATFVAGHLIIIGCLGYPRDRRPGFTPVYRLDCETYRMRALATRGENPGWVFKHTAEFDPSGDAIIIHGGEVLGGRGRGATFRPNPHTSRLDLTTLTWTRA